jgi:hypothetical protein
VDGDPPTMALKWLSELEREVSSRLPRRTKAKNPAAKAGWSWEKLLLDEFGKKSGSTKLPPEVEERAGRRRPRRWPSSTKADSASCAAGPGPARPRC